MSKNKLLTVIVLLSFMRLHAQEYNYKPVPVNDGLFNLDCFFKDSLNGWIVGSYGKTMHTTDGGRSWKRYNVDEIALKSVTFDHHTNQWWATGEDGAILKFSEDAHKWIKMDGVASETTLWMVRFSDLHRMGAAITGSGALLRYDYDRGEWVDSGTSSDNSLYGINFDRNENKVVICGEMGTLLMSSDTLLKKWKNVLPAGAPKYLTSKTFYSCMLANSENIWAGSADGNIVRVNLSTGDYTVVKVGESSITSMWCDAGSRTAVATNSIGEIFYTADRGNSWTLSHKTKTKSHLNSTYFFDDEKHGFVCGQYNSLLATKDGGKTWKEINPFRSFHEAASDPSGNIFFTENDGMSSINPGNKDPKIISPAGLKHKIYGIKVTKNKIWSCGEKSAVFSCRYDGAQWKTEHSEERGTDLYSIYYDDKHDVGIAVGAKSKVLVKQKGKNTWKQMELESTKQSLLTLNKVLCLENRCWILGDKGRLYLSDNLGTTWRRDESIAADRDLNSIAFSSKGTIGYITTTSKLSEPQLLKSTDSGAHWFVDNSLGFIDNISRIIFANDSTIFLGSTEGDIFRSNDAGGTWFKNLPSVANDNLCGLAIDANGALHAVGHNGIYFKTEKRDDTPVIKKFEVIPFNDGYRAIVMVGDKESSTENIAIKIRLDGEFAAGTDKSYRSVDIAYTGIDSLKYWPKAIFKPDSYCTFKLIVSDGWNIVRKDTTIFVGESVLAEIGHFMRWDQIPRTFDEFMDFMKVNVAVLLVLYTVGILAIFFFAPIQIFHWSEFLASSRLPYSDQLAPWLVFSLAANKKVLAAFVDKYGQKAIQMFESATDVSSRPFWIPAPFEVNGRPYYTFNPLSTDANYIPGLSELKSENLDNRIIISIEGQGGVGKSSLAFQIARWASEVNTKKRLLTNRSIPVFLNRVDRNVDELCRARVEFITDRKQVSEAFVHELLRQRFIIVVIDGLSEMSDYKKTYIDPEAGGRNSHLVVVTSRKALNLPSIYRVVPVGLKLDFLDTLLDGFITQYVGAFHFANEREVLRTRIKNIILDMSSAGKETTVPLLLLRLAVKKAERLIDDQKSIDEHFPTSFSMLIDDYIEEIFRNEDDLTDLLKDLRRAACTSIGFRTSIADSLPQLGTVAFRPLWVPESWYLNKLSKTALLKFLTGGLMIVSGSRDDRSLKFSYDPIAEYLAIKELFIKYRDGELPNDDFQKIMKAMEMANLNMYENLILLKDFLKHRPMEQTGSLGNAVVDD
ncbi:YCF48-related protein [Parachryseolinea silvisoli]|uniref:YCF48-related protein n=1 Tax=Parachryseolinea silvisoli TaxID=2873601 RepID=UPI00226598AD|nr:YCF48-related protein [Parachryseolinea silvisoli]MCD9015222.1 hypothetical protein [Parachryseolinea silvisoli]